MKNAELTLEYAWSHPHADIIDIMEAMSLKDASPKWCLARSLIFPLHENWVRQNFYSLTKSRPPGRCPSTRRMRAHLSRHRDWCDCGTSSLPEDASRGATWRYRGCLETRSPRTVDNRSAAYCC